jgi:hypothetical protein
MFINIYDKYTYMPVVISVRINDGLERQGIDINQGEGMKDIKVKEYVNKWIEELNDVKPSEEGFSIKSVREDRESH